MDLYSLFNEVRLTIARLTLFVYVQILQVENREVPACLWKGEVLTIWVAGNTASNLDSQHASIRGTQYI